MYARMYTSTYDTYDILQCMDCHGYGTLLYLIQINPLRWIKMRINCEHNYPNMRALIASIANWHWMQLAHPKVMQKLEELSTCCSCHGYNCRPMHVSISRAAAAAIAAGPLCCGLYICINIYLNSIVLLQSRHICAYILYVWNCKTCVHDQPGPIVFHLICHAWPWIGLHASHSL